MIRNILISSLLFFLISINVHADANSEATYLQSIETRDDGYHAVFIDHPIPDEQCTLTDRAIIHESAYGGKTMLNLALTALTHPKRVIIRVGGCTVISPDQTEHTAPVVKKVQILR